MVFESDNGPRCLSPVTVAEEVAEHLPALANKAKVDPNVALLALRAMPVDWQPPEVYQQFRKGSFGTHWGARSGRLARGSDGVGAAPARLVSR